MKLKLTVTLLAVCLVLAFPTLYLAGWIDQETETVLCASTSKVISFAPVPICRMDFL